MAICEYGTKKKNTAPSFFYVTIEDFRAVFGEDSPPYRLVLLVSEIPWLKHLVEPWIAKIVTSNLCSEEPPSPPEMTSAEILTIFGIISTLSIGLLPEISIFVFLQKLSKYVEYLKWFEFCTCEQHTIPDPPYVPPNLPPACKQCYQREGKFYTLFADGTHKFDDPNNLYGDEYWDIPHNWKMLPKEIRIELWLKRFEPNYSPQVFGTEPDYTFAGYFLGINTVNSLGAFRTFRPIQNNFGTSGSGVYGLPTDRDIRIFDAFTGHEYEPDNPANFVPPLCTKYRFDGACADGPDPEPEPIPDLPELEIPHPLFDCPVCQTVVEEKITMMLPNSNFDLQKEILTFKRLEPEETTPENQFLIDFLQSHPEYFEDCEDCPETEKANWTLKDFDETGETETKSEYITVDLIKE